MPALTESPQWLDLVQHRDRLASVTLRDLFRADPERARRLSLQAAGLFMDYSKQRVDDQALDALLELARARDLGGWMRRMFAGEAINNVEGRAAYHVALRAGDGDGEMAREPLSAVARTLAGMDRFCRAVRGGSLRGAGNEPFRTVLNLGIGGSDLGPRLVCEALDPLADAAAPAVHFVANIDGMALEMLLARLQPETTLVVVTSKSFSTAETLANAEVVRGWLTQALGEAAVPQHFVAVSANVERARDFGIPEGRVFEFWDWVGGRYSLWSAVGLPIALRLGMDRFRALLQGAKAMDQHFRTAPLQRNMPVLMGLIGIWNRNFLAMASQVVVPYSDLLAQLPAYLQQLEMESNGKSVDRDGRALAHSTVPAVWGQVGTSGQHAFFQMLHQGTEPLPVDFILPLQAEARYARLQHMMVANCLAQSEALMLGRDAAETRAALGEEATDAVVAHRTFPGNRPSTTLLMPRVDPFSLGALLALYEHKVFVQGVIWGINSFDQWGVELGKTLAADLEHAFDGGNAEGHDASTRQLLDRARRAMSSDI